MRWTIEEERACLQMVRQGMSNADIAEVLGRARESVTHFICAKRKKEPGVWKRINASGKPKHQKCDTCYYASGATKNRWKRPWADRLEPVEGWTADPVKYVLHNTNSGTKVTGTYAIHDCPRYEVG